MKQILINFVSNAIKFTPVDGNIEFRIKLNKINILENKKNLINFEINIIDSGIGISENGIKNLFINFGKLSENS